MHLIKTAQWQRVDIAGSESFELHETEHARLLSGRVVLKEEDEEATIEYLITVDRNWVTREATIDARRMDEHRKIHLVGDGRGTWRQDGHEIASVRSCLDVDLSFTPSTNLLPIRRLNLDVGKSARVAAAWLRYPELDWQMLEQEYERLSENAYEYRSRGGKFVAKLLVDEMGLVREYPGFWKMVAM